MKEKSGVRVLRSLYAILFSLLTVFVGALCVIQAWSIFKSEPSGAFTRARVWAHFKEIWIPIVVFVGALVGNIIIALAYPKQKEKLKAEIDPQVTARRLRDKVGGVKGARRERAFRAVVNVLITAITLFGLALCIGIMYVDSYTPMLSAEFFLKQDFLVDRLIRVVICAVSGLLACVILVSLKSLSLKREIAVYKAALVAKAKGNKEEKDGAWAAVCEKIALAKNEKELARARVEAKALLRKQEREEEKQPKVKKVKPKVNKNGSQAWIWAARIALFAVAIICIVSGVDNGGLKAMFVKAINVCTQCIGIG
ncbi:MAG: hypothetical protein IJY05_00410 [Clostridia bacterium]|nr:hypothetical protein [Clostridia bacterium]